MGASVGGSLPNCVDDCAELRARACSEPGGLRSFVSSEMRPRAPNCEITNHGSLEVEVEVVRWR